MKNKLLVVLGGATAVGKTGLAIKLAKHYDTEIISADSRQLYKELKIGVARPSEEELKQVKHHLIASHSIKQDYNAGSYAKEANKLITNLFERFDILFLVGGTGLYIEAATQGLNILPAKNIELRNELNKLHKKEGIIALQNRLKQADPMAELKDWENPQRLIRAIEIVLQTRKSLKDSIEFKLEPKEYKTLYLYLDMDRDQLYERINSRVESMIKQGLQAEANSLFKYKDLNALKTVGYTELFDYFDDKISLDRAIELIKQHSRNYAKRQITWFKNKSYLRIVNYKEGLEIINTELSKL